MSDAETFAVCADLLLESDSLLITAGAGMGVDWGLPDFRGTEGFWRAYPALGKARVRFEEIASPDAFRTDPLRAWGFYGHRLNLYRQTVPHAGFAILRELAAHMPHGAFVFTSNVDGQFQKAGFSGTRIAECHGSIHQLQRLHGCLDDIWSADEFEPQVDDVTCELLSDLPRCPHCQDIARPNILMFGDGRWQPSRAMVQEAQMTQWLGKVQRLVVIEIGAGIDIPTVRHFSQGAGAPLIRINPTAPELGQVRGISGISLRMGGLAALRGIWEAM